MGWAQITEPLQDRIGPMVALDLTKRDHSIAAHGMILRVQVGSGTHGTAIGGQDDRDEMAVCIEPFSSAIGLERFEHMQYRTQPEGVCSGPGDLDLIVYSLRKYIKLVTDGNPTVLVPLFVPHSEIAYVNEFGWKLLESRSLFLSKKSGQKFKGYLNSQRDGLMGLRSGGTRNQGRQDIRDKYGFDTKFAMHMVRLGLQGVELLTTGRITLPIPEPDLTWCRELRQGEHTKTEALDRAADLEDQITRLMTSPMSPLPDEPDRRRIDLWLADMHKEFWGWEG